jgi:hypothetical protein
VSESDTGMNDQPSALASTLIVREASIEDARAIAHVYVETARKQYAAIVARCAFARLSVGPLVRRWELLLMRRRWVRTAHIVENRAGRVVGFSAAGLTRCRASNLQLSSTRCMCCQRVKVKGWGVCCSIARWRRWRSKDSSQLSREYLWRTRQEASSKHSAGSGLARRRRSP